MNNDQETSQDVGASRLSGGFDERRKYMRQQIADAQAEVATWPDSVKRHTQLPDCLMSSNEPSSPAAEGSPATMTGYAPS